MSLRYRYKLLPVPQPVVSLGGRFSRPRPLIPVTVVGPADSALLEAALDTAADDTIFSEDVARLIGLDLTGAPTGSGMVVGGSVVTLRYAEVTLRLSDGVERREWRGWVGFAPAKLRNALLGFAGCLRFFDAQFFGGREEVELTVNALYPGT
jgi:hypothetical protein